MTYSVDPVSREMTAVTRAQQIVDRWLHAPRHAPFEQNLDRELDRSWDGFLSNDANCEAVRQVAHAIHAGRGHAHHDRSPLLAIAELVLGAEVSGPDRA